MRQGSTRSFQVRFRNLLSGAFLAVVTLCVPSASAADLSDATVTLTATKSGYSASDTVTVRVTMTNPNSEELRILSWLTPEDGVQASLFRVTREGEPADYLGVLIKRTAPTEADYVSLAAGESREYDVDLSEYYSFSESGDYAVTYDTGSPQLYLGRGTEGVNRNVASKPIRLHVAGRADPLRKLPAVQRVVGSTGFVGCTAGRQADLLTARNNANTFADDAILYFGDNRSGARYQKWFGAYNSSRWSTVETNYAMIGDAMDTQAVTFDCTCTSGSYAYVYANSPYVIYLCNSFWSAPATGTDSKAGTLIHEMSHFTVVAGTDDHVYGQSAAQALAISSPANAINNADTHEYFVENTPVTADNAPAYDLDLGSYDFGGLTVGATSGAQAFELTSTGDANLVLGMLSTTGDFAISGDGCSGQTLAPAGTCTVGVVFSPVGAGVRAGSLTIASNANVASPASLSGTGTGVPIVCGNGVQESGEECDDGNVLPNDGCSETCQTEPCAAVPLPSCNEAAQAQMQLNERTSGKEKLKLRWKKAADATTLLGFGDPVDDATEVALCLYNDAEELVATLLVDQGGQLCAGNPCWKPKGSAGYGYVDKGGNADGIAKVGYKSGAPGRGQADASGANNPNKGISALPTGIVAALAGNLQPTMQLVTSGGLCLGATMTEVTKDDGLQYKARKK